MIMCFLEFAQGERINLSTLQASRWTDKFLCPDKTIAEIILSITSRIVERLSWEKLPR